MASRAARPEAKRSGREMEFTCEDPGCGKTVKGGGPFARHRKHCPVAQGHAREGRIAATIREQKRGGRRGARRHPEPARAPIERTPPEARRTALHQSAPSCTNCTHHDMCVLRIRLDGLLRDAIEELLEKARTVTTEIPEESARPEISVDVAYGCGLWAGKR